MTGFYDPTTKPFESGYNIEFTHISSRSSVKFKAWVTALSDDYTSNWNSEEVYGRMDPIQTFHSTKRIITMSWDVVAASEAEAKENMIRASTLFQMLYPKYRGNTLKSPPLLRLKFLNLVQDVATGEGLVGTVGGFSFTPDMEQGFFDHAMSDGVIYPQTLKMQCTFTCLHSHNLGYRSTPEFPYNMGFQPETTQDSGAASSSTPSTAPATQSADADDAAKEKGVERAAGARMPIQPRISVAPTELTGEEETGDAAEEAHTLWTDDADAERGYGEAAATAEVIEESTPTPTSRAVTVAESKAAVTETPAEEEWKNVTRGGAAVRLPKKKKPMSAKEVEKLQAEISSPIDMWRSSWPKQSKQ